jgi:acetyl-CoA carboxylase carboxyl transferase subunit alpha
VLMLENSIYSVAMPEAAASIVWRDNSRKVEVAEQLQITSRDLLAMGVVEEVIEEPKGGAHLDPDGAARVLDLALTRHLEPLLRTPVEELLQHRYERFRYIDSLIRADADFGPKVGNSPA